MDRTQIREYINYLISERYLYLTDDEYPVLRLGDKAENVLFHNERVIYTYRQEKKDRPKASKITAMPVDDSLYEKLRAVRTRLAQQEGVPAYVVFSNATLLDMAAKQPQTLDEFLMVSGVGSKKAERYGKAFVECICNWNEENGDA